mgnify:CR=1 FL=1
MSTVFLTTGLDCSDTRELEVRGHKVRSLIMSAEFPQELSDKITASYATLCKEFGVDEVDTAVRSSATGRKKERKRK